MLAVALLKSFSFDVDTKRELFRTVVRTMAFWWTILMISFGYHKNKERLTVRQTGCLRCLALRLQRHYQRLYHVDLGNRREFAFTGAS